MQKIHILKAESITIISPFLYRKNYIQQLSNTNLLGRWLQCHWMSAVASALSNRQNCTCARKILQTQWGRTHGAGCVRQWFRTAEPLGERRYENWPNSIVHTHTHSHTHTHTHTQRVIWCLPVLDSIYITKTVNENMRLLLP